VKDRELASDLTQNVFVSEAEFIELQDIINQAFNSLSNKPWTALLLLLFAIKLVIILN